jgi:hypothetical protein
LQVAVQSFEDANSSAFTFFDEPQQQVFHTDVVVAEAKGFFPAE